MAIKNYQTCSNAKSFNWLWKLGGKTNFHSIWKAFGVHKRLSFKEVFKLYDRCKKISEWAKEKSVFHRNNLLICFQGNIYRKAIRTRMVLGFHLGRFRSIWNFSRWIPLNSWKKGIVDEWRRIRFYFLIYFKATWSINKESFVCFVNS